jgi:hypothetical protein
VSLPRDYREQEHCADDAFRAKTCSKKPSKSVRASLLFTAHGSCSRTNIITAQEAMEKFTVEKVRHIGGYMILSGVHVTDTAHRRLLTTSSARFVEAQRLVHD